MKLQLVSVGTKPPGWLSTGFEEYNKRLPAELKIQLREIPVARRSASASTQQLIDKEGEQMLACLKKDMRVVALDIEGENWSTMIMAKKMEAWQMEGQDLSFMIGGPDGMSAACGARANHRWSLSRLTLPHFLVRVLVAEQIYRCWTLMNNHPYHK